jgi:hypothetical protein
MKEGRKEFLKLFAKISVIWVALMVAILSFWGVIIAICAVAVKWAFSS